MLDRGVDFQPVFHVAISLHDSPPRAFKLGSSVLEDDDRADFVDKVLISIIMELNCSGSNNCFGVSLEMILGVKSDGHLSRHTNSSGRVVSIMHVHIVCVHHVIR